MSRSVRPRSTAVVALSLALALALALALTVSACTDDGARSPRGTGTPGAAGLRDPYFPQTGNGGYDVTHYALTLDVDLERNSDPAHHLTGTAVITARATQNLSAFNLDLKGLDVESVTVEGEAARWKRAGQELTVRPRAGLGKGKTFRATVRYSGSPRIITDPDGSQEGWLPTTDGALALGEPTGSMTWFPGNHHPSDKATYDITVTVPKGLHAVSNGELRDESVKDGRTTYAWRSTDPMASYVATVAIGTYEIRRTVAGQLPVYVAVDPAQAKDSRAVLDRIPQVMKWAEDRFGPYPFSSTGAIVDSPGAAGYALETQNRPFFPGAPDLRLLVHELVHQWYGNSVTPKTWRDMWLNEGFATYAEWLWQEDHGGDTAQEIFDAVYEGRHHPDAASGEAVWAFPPANPPSADRISDPPVYERGAMVLHKIRQAIGDAPFFDLLQNWATTHRHGNANTADFTAYAEKFARKRKTRADAGSGATSDVDLALVWKEWLYGDGKPPKA
ncbi:metallopeptidase [Streptomyces capitiformicae]|uniref:Aminopeptidase N n=1 Tax=Streptomyces capitiformicae TaxID=2014920 RepID=A0A918Z1R0_9ACTN|nr:metallopeptidase [Streptomyces capitiformicae]